MSRRGWLVRIANPAAADIRDIIRWTDGRFGAVQARAYLAGINASIKGLKAGPGQVGVRSRSELGTGLYTARVMVSQRLGSHLILFKIDLDERVIEVMRVLHVAMDLTLHAQRE